MFAKRQLFLVLGLSRSGRASAEFLLSRNATTYIYDDLTSERVEQTANELVKKGARRVSKEQLSKMSDACDALVLSPGIPIDHPLAVAFKRKGKAVLGETELAVRNMRCPIIAVTGTNGKTTTVSLITETLKNGGYKASACGNIGQPMTDFCGMQEEEIAVAEISSFQLETLNSICPHIAVALNISEDHLNRHYNMENYIFLKAKLFKNCTETEYAVLNYDDSVLRGFAEKTKAQTLWFSLRERVQGAYLENGALWFLGEKIMDARDLFAEGLHNIQNALATVCVAKIMGVKTEIIAKSLSAFKGIKHRLQRVGVANGVTFIDDSKGTNVDATIKAVQAMKENTVLLLGGKNKGYDYAPLFVALKNSKVTHAVLYGENRYELLKSARGNGFENITVCNAFDFAVKVATLKAQSGETVLLSPASASFDAFTSYEERGDRFVEIVSALGAKNDAIKEEEDGKQPVENENDDGDDGDDGEDDALNDALEKRQSDEDE